MPYTPPSQRSPASSAPSSPDVSRRSSFQGQNGSRPQLPRSASYLTRHRRTPSAVETKNGPIEQPTREATCDDLKAIVIGGSVRQSPPPRTDGLGMPTGAIISPPESSSSSDEDDMPEVRGRRIENLKELQDAISQIPQHRESSPSKANGSSTKDMTDAGDLLVLPSQAEVISEGMHHSFSAITLDELAVGRRKFSHSRSVTEPNIAISKSAGNSLTGSEEDSEEEEMVRKPQMVRKKSGELVRPALRPPSRRRPSSMPGTPTFSKAVHFDSHLEHVRHFLQVDRPLAVSAGSSPVDNYDSDTEYPFHTEEKSPRTPPFEWEIIMSNFPVETPARKAQPVRLERVWLSNDQKCLIGSVVVANLAFQKYVTCRFTLDYWKTTSEVAAEYMTDIRPKETSEGQDKFNFTIKLSDLANLESKTLYFCIRYNVNGQELWDNNGGTNFQVDFRKKMVPQNGKKGNIGAANRPANGLPRSNRRPGASTTARPKSMPVGIDEFGNNNSKINFDQSILDYLGESGPTMLRLKGVKSSGNLPSDNLSARLSSPSGQAFANRYDFGASLTAAVQAAKDAMNGKPDGLYMKLGRKHTPIPMVAPNLVTSPTEIKDNRKTNTIATTSNTTIPGADSPSASISSSSYEELVNKYCFFGSKQSSPQLKDGTLRSGRFDGADDGATRGSSSSTSSSDGSPVQFDQATRPAHGAQQHTLHPNDPNPYFQHSENVSPVGPSRSESPLQRLAIHRNGSPGTLPRTSSPSSQPTGRSTSPATLVGSFAPFAGMSPNEFPYQHLHDRFPFVGTDAHGTATAIRG